MEPKIPLALKREHDALHAELAELTHRPGKVGEVARRVAASLHAHFVREEEYALPPLGLLTALASGQLTPGMRGVVALTDRLKADLPRMLAEHRVVVAELEALGAAAKTVSDPQAARFAEALKLHAETEEQVLYPAAILVGEWIKTRLEAAPGTPSP